MEVFAKILTMACVICGLSGGCSKQPQAPEATDSAAATDPLTDLNRQLQFAPHDHELYARRSLLHYERGKVAEAFADIRRAIALDSLKMVPAYAVQLGFLFFTQHQDDSAAKYYDMGIRGGSRDPEGFHQFGNLQVTKGNLEKALQLFNKAVEHSPDEPVYYVARGYVYRKMKKPFAAIQEYQLALTKDGKFIKALSELFEVYFYDMRRTQEATPYNDRILAADSLHPLGQFYTGELYFQKAQQAGNPNQRKILLQSAITPYSLAIARDPQFARAYYSRGYAYFELQQFEKALADFQLAGKYNPEDYRAFFMQGSIFELHDDITSARDAYQQALAIYPNFIEAKHALSELSGR